MGSDEKRSLDEWPHARPRLADAAEGSEARGEISAGHLGTRRTFRGLYRELEWFRRGTGFADGLFLFVPKSARKFWRGRGVHSRQCEGFRWRGLSRHPRGDRCTGEGVSD